MIVELALFAQLAASCAPRVAVETLAAVARTESGFDALAIHDNATGRSFKSATRAEAIGLATELVAVHRHSVDLGLMQINSANFPRLGMTITDAFDPCRSLAAADRVLVLGDVLNNMDVATGIRGLREPKRIFTPDPARNRESARRLAALEPALVCFGHGPPLRDTRRFVDFVAGLPA